MSDAYVECMVARRTPAWQSFVKYLLYFLCVVAVLASFIGFGVIALIVAIGIGVGAYFFGLNTDLEFEYLYLDKEITVDKIMGKARRKRVAVYSLDKIEILAPIKSYHLDGYKNREMKTLDYSCGFEDQPDKRYVFIYEGGTKVIIQPTEEFVKVVKNVAPRKVFTD